MKIIMLLTISALLSACASSPAPTLPARKRLPAAAATTTPAPLISAENGPLSQSTLLVVKPVTNPRALALGSARTQFPMGKELVYLGAHREQVLQCEASLVLLRVKPQNLVTVGAQKEIYSLKSQAQKPTAENVYNPKRPPSSLLEAYRFHQDTDYVFENVSNNRADTATKKEMHVSCRGKANSRPALPSLTVGRMNKMFSHFYTTNKPVDEVKTASFPLEN